MNSDYLHEIKGKDTNNNLNYKDFWLKFVISWYYNVNQRGVSLTLSLYQTEISTADLDAVDVYLGEMVFVTTFIYQCVVGFCIGIDAYP